MKAKDLNVEKDGIQVTTYEQPRKPIPIDCARQQGCPYICRLYCSGQCDSWCNCWDTCSSQCGGNPTLESSEDSSHYSGDMSTNSTSVYNGEYSFCM